MLDGKVIAVVIPCFRVHRQIKDVIGSIGPEVDFIVAVDDACPDSSGKVVSSLGQSRVHVLTREENGGVGAAFIDGANFAVSLGADIVVKLDGDGQMDPNLIPEFTRPISLDVADYTKGNRFSSMDSLSQMPKTRLVGNSALSLLMKFVSGYWSASDPTNGYFALRATALTQSFLGRLHPRYYLESSLLVEARLADLRLKQISIPARYGDEESSLSVWKVLLTFPWLMLRAMVRRLAIQYFLRDWSLGTFYLPLALLMGPFGVIFGSQAFSEARRLGEYTSAGQAVISAFCILLSVQFALAFLSIDMASEKRG